MKQTNNRNRLMLSAAPFALAAALGATPALADILAESVLIGTSGDGLIFADPAEGVNPPGIKAVTFTSTRNPAFDNALPEDPITNPRFLPPYENVVTNFLDLNGDDNFDDPLASRGEVPNCLIANNPDVYCDSAPGSGKRIKTWLTGPVPFDMRLRTESAYTDEFGDPVDVSRVDYFNFGKVSNFTGARITGMSIELLRADGTLMDPADSANSVLFDLAADVVDNLGLGARLVDGLFGAGGQEGDIGFFSDARAGFSLDESENTLDFGVQIDPATALLSNVFYVDNFGDSFLDNTMIPDGIFWDDDGDPTNESALLAWYNPSAGAGAWVWGNLALAADVEARAQEIVDDLGLTQTGTAVEALGYAAGGLIDPTIVAEMEADELFEIDVIEDLRNANINYTIAVGMIDGNEFIIRTTPRFAEIVEETATQAQFVTAGNLDALANVPYLGADDGYGDMVDTIVALDDPAAQQEAIEQLGYSFLAAYGATGFATGREQVFALGQPWDNEPGAQVTRGGPTWAMGENLSGFVSIAGGRATYDPTSNNAGFELDTRSIFAGLETEVAPMTSFGVMLGALNTNADIDGGRGELDGDGYGAAVFGRSTFGQSGRVQAMIGFQKLDVDSTRNVIFASEVASASTDVDVTFAAIQADYMMRSGALNWGPMGSLEYYRVKTDAFTETGAGIWNMSVGAQTDEVTIATAGVRANTSFMSAGGWDVTPFGHLALTSRSGDAATVGTGFGTNSAFAMPVDAADATWVDVGLGVSATSGGPGNSLQRVGLEYRGAFDSDYKGHAVRAYFDMRF